MKKETFVFVWPKYANRWTGREQEFACEELDIAIAEDLKSKGIEVADDESVWRVLRLDSQMLNVDGSLTTLGKCKVRDVKEFADVFEALKAYLVK